MHLDQFQRLVVDPASVSVVTLHAAAAVRRARQRRRRRPVLPRAAQERSRPARRPRSSDAAVGGGAGAADVGIGSAPWRASSSSTTRRERFVAGTVGEPGQRTFFLQATGGGRTTSVALEKQQVSVLAERVDALLDEVAAPVGGEAAVPAVTPVGRRGQRPAGRARSRRSSGSARWRWPGTATTSVVVIEAQAVTEDEARRRAAADRRGRRGRARRCCGCGSPAPSARAFVKRAQAVVVGRPAAVPVLRRPAGRRRARLPARQRLPALRSPRRAPVTRARRRDGARPAAPRARSPSRAGWSTPPTRRCSARSSLDGSRGALRLQAGRGASARCGTSPTARWPGGRSRRTPCRRPPAGTSCRRR